MTFSPDTTKVLSNQILGEFIDYLNELEDDRLCEIYADAANRFLLEEYNGAIDEELEMEIATNLIVNLRVVNVPF